MKDSDSLEALFFTANRRQSYPKGSTIVYRGGNLDYVYYIDSGLVKVCDFDMFGSERIVMIAPEGRMLPISWVMSRQPPDGAMYDYIAITNVTCYILPIQQVRNYITDNPVLCRDITEQTIKMYVNATARIYNLQRSNVIEKIEFVFYYLAIVLGKKLDDTSYIVEAPFTHNQLAGLAGLSREAVSHELRKERYRDVYYKKDGSTIIDISKIDTAHMPYLYSMRRTA